MSGPGTGELPDDLRYADWAAAVENGRLLGQECADCGHVTGAPMGACPRCGARDLSTVDLPATGEVYSETLLNVPPVQFAEASYQVALVRLGEARVMARIDGGQVAIGDEVELSGVVDEDDGHPAPVFEGR